VPLISTVTTCKGRLAHLQQTLPALMRTGWEVVVVDYDCPDGAAAWVRANHPEARVVDVCERPLFNAAEARNLGAAAATGEWLFFLDADVMLDPDIAETLEPRLTGRLSYLMAPEPRPYELWGSILVSRAWFDALGGYDEVFEGWGAEDMDLLERLVIREARQGELPEGMLSSIPHDDAERSRFHAIGDVKLNATINGLYRTAKNDLGRLGEWLERDDRRRLYASIREALTSASGVRRIQAPVHARPLPNFDVHVSLNYDIKPRPPADP